MLFDVVLTELLTGGLVSVIGFQARLTRRSTGHSPTRIIKVNVSDELGLYFVSSLSQECCFPLISLGSLSHEVTFTDSKEACGSFYADVGAFVAF